ncbi:hypothetical protein [Mycobacteroides chelonae]|uniref:hypothetical protein n=1 Tax=Mycobacteroides chelonae TaxID=1774 RepID=UPI0008A8E6D5|nr:hypothetical protein [Mycobacteroides chelonae]OHU48906.1 hypothetical protein BKG81_16000 [Mycobacteroides chelonae]
MTTDDEVLAQRLLLAVLRQDPVSVQAVATDIADGQTLARLSTHFMGWALNALLHMTGGDIDKTMQLIEHGLLKDLDGRGRWRA